MGPESLGAPSGAIGHGAGHRINDDVFRARIILGAVRVLDSEHVAGTFDQSILKTAASAEKRPVAPAREFNAFQHAVKTLVGTARRSPDPVEALQFLVCPGLLQTRRGDPHSFDREIELRGGVLQRLFDGWKSRRFGIVVSENCNADGIAHLGILEEKLGSAAIGR